MYPPAAARPENMRPTAIREELISSVERSHGSLLPRTVVEINPFAPHPSNLPGFSMHRHSEVWFCFPSKESKHNTSGVWKAEGDPYEIPLESGIIVRTCTFVFEEGRTAYQHKPHWVMQEFRIEQGGLCEGSNAREASSLCRVFQNSEQSKTHQTLQSWASADSADRARARCPNQSNFPDSQSSTNRPQVNKNDGPNVFSLTGEDADLFLGGDYMEVNDLDLEFSSSSRGSWSTASSAEGFYPEELLQCLDSENTQKDVGCKFSVSATQMPDEVIVVEAPSARISCRRQTLPPEEIPKTANSKDAPKLSSRNQNSRFRDKGPSSSNHNVDPSSSSRTTHSIGRNGVAAGRKKKFMDYLCSFLPF